MKEFLRIVADHYLKPIEGWTDAERGTALSSYLFVFPNRRSGLFMEHYLSEALDHPIFAPRTTTIAEVFTQFSDLRVLDRTSLLFRLYTLYQRLAKTAESFDSFVFWGDILLSDFNDVDEYLVDARQLFSNIRDLKEIDLLYGSMSEEEKAVVERFWRSVTQLTEERKKQVFEETWSILYDLYKTFGEQLRQEGLAYEGMLERDVILRLKQQGTGESKEIQSLLRAEKVVFVGLTAITETERNLMKWLQKAGIAEFCWDYDDPRLREGAMRSQGAFFTKRNLSDFPDAISAEERADSLVKDQEREFNVYVVPSGVGQTHVAAQQLEAWHIDTPEEAFRTAVVLPDERLLVPMVYALPKDVPSYNITMGYSLKSTAVSAFVDHLASLQLTLRKSGGETAYFFRSVLPLLSHHFTLNMCGDKAWELNHAINEQGRYVVPQSMLTESQDPWLKLVFRPVRNAKETIDYLQSLFAHLLRHAAADKEEKQFTVFDREFIYAYSEVLDRLAQLVKGVEWTFNPQTLFHLLQQLTRGISVPFSGEPLSGLQLMGVLETRSLDFDRVILLSMNEGVFPAKTVANTFIPMSLRSAFHLPTQQHRDAVFAYHFYRLLSRASQVTLIYDSRADGLQSGEESRYLMQLRYLYGVDLANHTHFIQYPFTSVETRPVSYDKTPEVMSLLEPYKEGGNKSFSATAFKIYRNCTLQFYLTYLRGLSQDDEVKEELGYDVFGNIYHRVMEVLYRPLIGRQVTSDVIRNLRQNDALIYNKVREIFQQELGGEQLTGYHQLIVDIIVTYVKHTLRHDEGLSPLQIVALEEGENFIYEVRPGLRIRLKGIYDRIDLYDGALRVVDYKTSNPSGKLALPKSDEAFQVMLYGMMLAKFPQELTRKANVDVERYPLEGHLYHVRKFTDPKVSTRLQGEKGDIQNLRDAMETFEADFRTMVNELFDPSVPFSQVEDEKKCAYCPFVDLCQRQPKEF